MSASSPGVRTGGTAARVAIVIPCYRSAASIPELARRLVAALTTAGHAHEILFIDDASPSPATWTAIRQTRSEFPDTVRGCRLATNVGQHNAIQCGFAQLSPGVEVVVTMDDDLQHRPEDVPALVQAVDEGADLAIGAYDVKQHAGWRNLGGRITDGALRRLFGLPSGFQLTSFRAIRRFATDDVLENRSRYSYLSAALLSATCHRVNVPVSHEARVEGRSGYSLATSAELAANLFLSYSRWPLYMVVGLFAASFLGTSAIMAWAFIRWLVADHAPEGWASTIMVLGITSTFNLAGLAVVALLSTRSHRQLVGASGGWRIAEQD